jgi:molybdopterin-biosynthesis enzyme MoeA-like protein
VSPEPVPVSHHTLGFIFSVASHFGIPQLFSFNLSIASVVELILHGLPMKIVNWPIVKNYLARRLKEATSHEASVLIELYSNYFDESVIQELLIIHQGSVQISTFLKNHLVSLRRITIEISRKYNDQIAILQARIELLENLNSNSNGNHSCPRCAHGL